MLKRIILIIAVITLFSILLISGSSAQYTGQSKFNRRKIVVFSKNTVNKKTQKALVQSVGGVADKSLPIVNGMVVSLPSKTSERALRGRKGIARIEDDIIVSVLRKSAPVRTLKRNRTPAPPPAQTLEWGVNRIDADLAWASSKGTAAKVAVIDTGIDKTHPDLVANIKGGINFVKSKRSVDPTNWNDDNGHGTHVAGIIAAADNSVGVIGVAPQANLYAVKVLNSKGSGYLSDVISGINWAAANDMDVINMSLGSNSDSPSLHDAVDNAFASGVVVVAAAGNDGSSVDYPAAYSSVVAVGATDSTNTIASWSSNGPEVELSAPGVNIRSTWKGGGYNTISGTSMASPHVAGTAALVLKTAIPSSYDINGNGLWEPIEVRNALKTTADDLGATGFDNHYGFGLVDAEESVTGTQTNP
jgi:subtilisin